MKIKLYILLLFSTALFAQKATVFIDTTKNKIGAEFKLTIKAVVDTSSKVVFPTTKNFGLLEVIRSYAIDTIKNNDKYELIKKYGLTQFDTGRFTIPRIPILINNKPFFTDSIAVEVSNVVVDTLKQKMFDIKPIAEASSSKSWIWKLLLVLLLLAGVGAFVYWWLKIRQKKKIEAEAFKTPIERATSLLNTLEKKELWQKGEIKAYYSELTDIARNYIEEAIEIPAMECTTAELIEAIRKASQKKKMALSKETIENLEQVLRQADLVKFAKSKPLDFEITEDRKKIEKSIIILDKSIPVIEENQDELLLNELQRKEQIKKQLQKKRKSRILTAVGIVLGAIIGLFIFFVITKGFDFVKDNILGNQSKELLEGEWVYSEYGNPSVAIETPKVLKRVDLTNTLPKEGLALIKDMQSFAYGSLISDFYLMVSTVNYKQQAEVDLSNALESSLKMIELQGGQNMIVKQEEFNTKQGIKGIKGYGTFSRINMLTKTSSKIYYEIVLFSQNEGLQQIFIMHEEGDQYANQISERILNSVELKVANE
ncbi:hypothetical protein [Flavobacterium luteum]|uniref:Protein BatD n=1 Tax=Flavobacterium luteum TaxID=2026654 RepID=A0A7J5AEL6_9FLAO|nr:hypothetical protein [Flavobacterium luteum]KAB1156000.1 hypothetical protein F6464_07300 [Flavobacterium luteum]